MASTDTGTGTEVARQMLAAADNDITRFFGFFTDDAVFRMGNNAEVSGRDAVIAWVSDYLGAVTGLRHAILEEFVSGDVVALRVEVTYTMRNGATFTLPAVTRTRIRGGKVSEYLIFMDPSPVVEAS